MHPRGNFMSILLAVLSCAVIVRARRVAPLIEEDWAKRPHRAAGKSSQTFQSSTSSTFSYYRRLFASSVVRVINNDHFDRVE